MSSLEYYVSKTILYDSYWGDGMEEKDGTFRIIVNCVRLPTLRFPCGDGCIHSDSGHRSFCSHTRRRKSCHYQLGHYMIQAVPAAARKIWFSAGTGECGAWYIVPCGAPLSGAGGAANAAAAACKQCPGGEVG